MNPENQEKVKSTTVAYSKMTLNNFNLDIRYENRNWIPVPRLLPNDQWENHN